MTVRDLQDRDGQGFHTGVLVHVQMVNCGRQGIKIFTVQGNHDAHGRISHQIP